MPRTKRQTNAVLKKLRTFGLSYPEAHTKSPWPTHMDLAVNDKTFVYLPTDGEPLSISCKLPQSCEIALMLPFVKPTGYGLGKSGWVSASFDDDTPVDLDMLKAWIDESYRAQAPKRLVKQLGGAAAPEEKPSTKKKKSSPKKKSPSKKKETAAKKKRPAKKVASKKRLGSTKRRR